MRRVLGDVAGLLILLPFVPFRQPIVEAQKTAYGPSLPRLVLFKPGPSDATGFVSVAETRDGKMLQRFLNVSANRFTNFHVSPSTKFMLWEAAPNRSPPFRMYCRGIANNRPRAENLIWVHQEPERLVSWDNGFDRALYFGQPVTTTSKGTVALPSFTVIDVATHSMVQVRSDANSYLLSAYWSVDGQHLIYSAVPWRMPTKRRGNGFVTTVYPANAGPTKYFSAVLQNRNGRLSLDAPKLISGADVDSGIGPTTRSIVHFYETHD